MKLREKLIKLKKEQNDKIFDLKRDFEHMRERICVACGGHFYSDTFLVDAPTALDPSRTAYCKMCDVCDKKIYVNYHRLKPVASYF